CNGPPMSARRSTRCIQPANRSPSCPPIPRPRRSTRPPANERDRARGRLIASDNDVVGGGETPGIVGAAFCRGDPDLAICLAVLPALSVSLADRRVLALPSDILRWHDVRR